MAALGLLGAPLHPHLPPLIQFPPWWLLVQHGLGCYSLPSSTGGAAFPISVPGGNKDQEGGSQVPDIPLHPASATKMSCSSSKAAGCSLRAPHFIIFLAQAAHPTPGWDFFLHPLAEPVPPHADPCWKQQQWEVLVLSFPQPWLCCPAARAVFAPLVPNSGYLPPPLPLNL